ncbi:hypothetical protein ABID99_001790 [Mucilaginibacter sp. OAE612]
MLFKIKVLCVGITLSLCSLLSFAQQINYPPVDKVVADY